MASCAGNKNENSESSSSDEPKASTSIVELNAQQREALNLQLGTIQMRNLTTLVKTNGKLEVPPSSSAEVTAVIGGNVKEIKVFQGDKVSRGQTLALLEHPDYITLQEDFAETANKLEFVTAEYNRQKELFENNVGAGKDFQQVKSEYNTVKAKYQGLKSRLRLLNLSPESVLKGNISSVVPVVSPINGYVNEVNVKLGTYVDATEKLFCIADDRDIHADFLVYENDIFLVKNGQKVDFTVANRPGEELSATIFAVGKEFEPNSRAIPVHAKLDRNPGNLIPGMYVSGHINTDRNNVPTLPNEAIVKEGIKSFIFVLDDSDSNSEDTSKQSRSNADIMKFKMVEIVVGKQDEGYTEIKLLSPLPENTKIVINAAYYLLAEMKKEETGEE
jgi:cobalt-zinc-cadmium efflux system membrane fusion protein